MKKTRTNIYRQIITIALLIGGTFNLVAPVMAAGTKPGTSISNTATATYDDDADPNNGTFNATSNTVVITVAEVAGITNVGSGSVDENGGSVQPGDVLNYNYTITNVGNDPTQIFIPSTVTISGPGTSGAIQYSTDGGRTYTNVAAGGATTGSIAVGSTVLVRVPVTVSSAARSGNFISVVLGDTGANDNSAGTQNQPDAPDTALAREVRTVDNADGTTGETLGAPANGEREASALQAIQVGSLPGLVSGPNGAPEAIATTNNDDFTNKSAVIPAGTNPGTAYDPAAVSFINTVRNASTGDSVVVSLLPTSPIDKASLPVDTLVTITYGGATAIYRYNGTSFEFRQNGSAGNSSDGNPISATNPVDVGLLAPNASVNYTVSVDLPSSAQLVGYGVPITAFQDLNNDGQIAFTDTDADNVYDPGEETQPANTTIDRVYTGYLRLTKESRLLQGDGSAVSTTDGSFSINPKSPAPGNIIEYRITYTNISSIPVGTNNVTISASRIVITEDGTAGTNNWARDNDSDGRLDTSNVVGSARDAGGSVAITPGDTVDATSYVDTVTNSLAPNTSGTFIFQRKVN